MTRTIRSFALAVAAAVVLSACGVLNALIPDQDIAGGILGIGSAGVQVPLEAAVADAGIGAAQAGFATVFTGTFDLGAVDVDAIDELPDFVEADAITETVALGDSIEVTYPTGGDVASFTLTELAVTGSITISGTEYALPVLTAGELEVLFDDVDCVGTVCTYGTASNLPELDVALAAAAVDAYASLLKDGGSVSAELTVTATLEAPGLADDATVVVTIQSLGAVIEF
ncbi:MAG: hypothetical protein ABR510_12970 [Trueperaceae bacterium]